MADPKTASVAKKTVRRTAKPKDVFMLYRGDSVPADMKFTKEAIEVLEACQNDSGLKYVKVTLPAPKTRGPRSA